MDSGIVKATSNGAAEASTADAAHEAGLAADATLELRDGAETGVARFCEQAFVNPQSARTGSNALLTAFDDSGLWLANLVQPQHLVAELRQCSCTLTRVIVTQWTRQGETHKLSRLGSALEEAAPPVKSHEAGQIMALLASLLGVLRPGRAQALLEASRPLLRDSTDPHLLKEASEWVAVGRVLESLSSEDRVFWNRRLREPAEDWDWETAEARGALRRLAPLINERDDEGRDLSLFQRTVPGCWWDMIREPVAEGAEAETGTLGRKRRHGHFITAFALGSLAGAAVMATIAATWWEGGQLDRVSNFSIPHVLRSPLNAFATVKQEVDSPQALERQAAAEKIAKDHPHLERLHSLAKNGTLRENQNVINGRSSLAFFSTPDYRALIRWLMLDPPAQPEARTAVAKNASRALLPDELLRTLELCIYPGSPNEAEARECAGWVLELGNEALTAQQKVVLESLHRATAKL